jgi:hypothetical protein
MKEDISSTCINKGKNNWAQDTRWVYEHYVMLLSSRLRLEPTGIGHMPSGWAQAHNPSPKGNRCSPNTWAQVHNPSIKGVRLRPPLSRSPTPRLGSVARAHEVLGAHPTPRLRHVIWAQRTLNKGPVIRLMTILETHYRLVPKINIFLSNIKKYK